jgi:general stress protein 26
MQASNSVIASARTLAEGAGGVVLVTVDRGRPSARPVKDYTFVGDRMIVLPTQASAKKVRHALANPASAVFVTSDQQYAMFRGVARIISALPARKQLWQPAWSEAYPGGESSPEVVLYQVDIDDVTFRDYRTGVQSHARIASSGRITDVTPNESDVNPPYRATVESEGIPADAD